MTKRERSKPARPIKTRRDYVGASAVVKRLSGESGQDSAAETRLQLLLRELDQFEAPEDEASADAPENFDYSGPRRRWSDDSAGTE
jgi:hypothetical protein